MASTADGDPLLESGELQPEDKLLIETLARDIVTAERLAQKEPAVVPAEPRAGRT